VRTKTLIVLAVAIVAAVAAQRGPSQTRASIRVQGVVSLTPVIISQRCKFTSAGAKVLVATCAQFGTYSGKPGAAGASYSWRWYLEVGPKGTTTGVAVEKARLALNFGKLGILRLIMTGRQVPVGAVTTNAAKGKTTGTWKFESGTKGLAGRKGSGRYVFETSRTGKTTFQIARLTLSGTLQ
jgi:hypothetical protein